MRLQLDLDLDALGDDAPAEAARILRDWADALGRTDLDAPARHDLLDQESAPVGSLTLVGAAAQDPKAVLHRYLRGLREALLWKVDGLGERDARWPMTPTGTNLLGLLKHVASVESEYLGLVFGRPFPEELPWSAEDAEDNADMWAWPEEDVRSVRDLAIRVWSHGDATIEALEADAPGHVHWWGENGADVTLHTVLVHVVIEVARHTGHADVLRELTDGSRGLREGSSNLPPVDEDYWVAHVAKLQQVAEEADARDL